MNAFFRWIIYRFPHLKGCVVSLLLFCVIELFFQGKVTVSLANHPPPSSSPPSPRPLFSWSSERVWKRWIITASFGRMQTLQVSTRVSLTCLLNTFFNCDFLITVFFARISNRMFVFISNGRTIPHRWHGKKFQPDIQPHKKRVSLYRKMLACDVTHGMHPLFHKENPLR